MFSIKTLGNTAFIITFLIGLFYAQTLFEIVMMLSLIVVLSIDTIMDLY